MHRLFFIALTGVVSALFISGNALSQEQGTVIRIKKSVDFEIDGTGSSSHWQTANWVEIPQRTFKGKAFSTKVKMLYSDKGLYFLFDCEDEKLSAAMNADFLDLWKEDVVEVFLWTDDSEPSYFEYELSPLNYELPLLISNYDLDLARWMPFYYEENRKVKHATSIMGGPKVSGASIRGWVGEFFIPYQLLRPLNNIFPKPGTEWRINLYRVDYDSGSGDSWSWQLTKGSFHQIKVFGRLVFEP